MENSCETCVVKLRGEGGGNACAGCPYRIVRSVRRMLEKGGNG